MNTRRSFRPAVLDSLEARDVPSSIGFTGFHATAPTHPAAAVSTPSTGVTGITFTLGTGAGAGLAFGSGPGYGGTYTLGHRGAVGFGSTFSSTPATFSSTPITTPTTHPFSPPRLGFNAPPVSDPWTTYLSHPNKLSTDPAVLNGHADFVYNGQWALLS